MADLNILVAVGVALIVGYVGYRSVFGSSLSDDSPFASASAAPTDGSDPRDFVGAMKRNKKQVIVFYGSQTGTSEDFASKLAKDLSGRFGLKAMVADPEDYDFDRFDTLQEDRLAIFLMASYGEGEPTDNAVDFVTFIKQEPEFSEGDTQIANARIAVFGLGNSSYEKYNQVGRDTFEALTTLGARPIVRYGEGDDGKGTLEDDFVAWKEELFTAIIKEWGMEEHEAVYEPTVSVEPATNVSASSPDVYLGEPNLKHLVASKTGEPVQGPFNPSNPQLARAVSARQLMKGSDRQCVHLELDATSLRYTTGDHLALWPQNSDDEVQRLVKALGIEAPHDVVRVTVLDKTSTVRVPSPTTVDTILRYRLEISGPVSRQVLGSIAAFAPTPEAKTEAKKLATDKDLFAEQVHAKGFNLARLMLALSKGQPWKDVPLSFVVESLPHLQPRFYSISSSSLETPDRVTITAVVERLRPAGSDHEVCGVATNNVLAIEHVLNGTPDETYALAGPHGSWQRNGELRVPVHIRNSLFKLPAKTTVPIIMIGPGTGVAPFRGFIHERAKQEADGKEIAKSLLFFGSRTREHDFLYGDEWPKFGKWLEVITAFSREGAKKVYVQDRIRERGAEVNELIEQGAAIYVCGDASRMARDVHQALIEVISRERNISEDGADGVIRKLRSRNKYQEDVW